jgi:hypothetical protein
MSVCLVVDLVERVPEYISTLLVRGIARRALSRRTPGGHGLVEVVMYRPGQTYHRHCRREVMMQVPIALYLCDIDMCIASKVPFLPDDGG